MEQIKNKVLLIEDDPLLVKMYLSKFESEGLEVKMAQDGDEGLKMALSGWADIILLDVMMPKLSGTDLLVRLRQDQKGKNALVLVLSNLSQEEEIKKAMSFGVKEYLIKANYTPSQIVEKIRKYLA